MRKNRPEWMDADGPRDKWLIYDSSSQRYKTLQAENQREAVQRAVMMGVVPKSTEHVRPRSGGDRKGMMSPGEFQEFLQKLKGE